MIAKTAPRLLGREDLRARGIRYSRQHLERLEKAGNFPQHVHVGDNTVAWIEAEVDAFIFSRIAARDAEAQPTRSKKERLAEETA
jgi:prophage regulatory protein